MIGSLLAGTDETPGEVYCIRADPIKPIVAWVDWCNGTWFSRPIFQAEVSQPLKLVPEGIEGQVPYKGPVKMCCIN